MSGGEQQRVAIARALVNNAGLIIADEPTGNIDPAMSIEIMDLLNHINKANGTTIIMVTHAHNLVKQYDHRVVVLKDGQLIADGYDRDAILALINPETPDSDAGFYNAPNEYDDVEKFIFSYGKKDIPIEETIPETPEILKDIPAQEPVEIAQETVEPEKESEIKQQENTADEKHYEASAAYSVAKDETINSILAEFAASTASRKLHLSADSIKETNTDTAEQTENDSSVSTSDDNGGDA